MRILIISDLHGKKDDLKHLIKEIDLLMVLGDCCCSLEELNVPKWIVRGNCDANFYPLEIVDNYLGKRFFLTHGHHYNVKETLNKIYYKSLEVASDYTLFGHTHIPFYSYESGIYFINPGSFMLEDNDISFYHNQKRIPMAVR